MSKKKKVTVVMVFGEDAADVYCDEGFMAMRKYIEGGNGGQLVKHEFDTEAERNAYIRGVWDMDGWFGAAMLEDEDVRRHPTIIKNMT